MVETFSPISPTLSFLPGAHLSRANIAPIRTHLVIHPDGAGLERSQEDTLYKDEEDLFRYVTLFAIKEYEAVCSGKTLALLPAELSISFTQCSLAFALLDPPEEIRTCLKEV